MKKFDRLKTIQLIAYVILTVICLVIVFVDKNLFHMIASQPDVRLMCIMTWIILGISFLFIYLDFGSFASFKHDYRELDYAVHSDPVAGIANRNSADVLIERYLNQQIPQNMGCVMFRLENLSETNDQHGHVKGNELIRDFSNILRMSSVRLCFVSRNGGNKFLALFEEGSIGKINTFLYRVDQKVQANNDVPDALPISYKYGIAFNEGDAATTVTDLISLSDKRIGQENTL